jgi:hypothetical protein
MSSRSNVVTQQHRHAATEARINVVTQEGVISTERSEWRDPCILFAVRLLFAVQLLPAGTFGAG